ncbi:MAG: hypothetical protein V4613_04630 [Bacteroidota bacterium]
MQHLKKIIFLLLCLQGLALYSQKYSDSFYKNIPVHQYYSKFKGEIKYDEYFKPTYYINNKEVSRSEYNKNCNQGECCPCLYQSYNDSDVLVYEAVTCGECAIGKYSEFYNNGKIKVRGQYETTNQKNFNKLYKSGNCSIKNGQWVYYKDNGDTAYSEFWDNDKFIKQVPEQNKTEIWKTELMFNNNIPYNNDTLTPEKIKQLTIHNFFKNKSQDSLDLKFEFYFAKPMLNNHYSIFLKADSLQFFDIRQYLIDNGFYKTGFGILSGLAIYNGDKRLRGYDIRLNVDLPEMPSQARINTIKHFPRQDIYLINSFNPKKRKKISFTFETELDYDDKLVDSLINSQSHAYNGQILHIDSANVLFRLYSESFNSINKFGVYTSTYKYYNYYLSDNYDDSIYTVNLNPKQLTNIYYTSASRNTFRSIGYGITIASAITTFIVAPLASINFNNGNFNKNRFYSIAGSGLIGISVGIPLIVLGRERYYNLTTPNGIKDKNYWYLK